MVDARPETIRPWLLSAPGVTMFAALLGTPLLLTLILSFYSFDFTAGIQTEFTLANYTEVLADSYFHLIFGRTFGIALLVAGYKGPKYFSAYLEAGKQQSN